jgi:hypothetical protein
MFDLRSHFGLAPTISSQDLIKTIAAILIREQYVNPYERRHLG